MCGGAARHLVEPWTGGMPARAGAGTPGGCPRPRRVRRGPWRTGRGRAQETLQESGSAHRADRWHRHTCRGAASRPRWHDPATIPRTAVPSSDASPSTRDVRPVLFGDAESLVHPRVPRSRDRSGPDSQSHEELLSVGPTRCVRGHWYIRGSGAIRSTARADHHDFSAAADRRASERAWSAKRRKPREPLLSLPRGRRSAARGGHAHGGEVTGRRAGPREGGGPSGSSSPSGILLGRDRSAAPPSSRSPRRPCCSCRCSPPDTGAGD